MGLTLLFCVFGSLFWLAFCRIVVYFGHAKKKVEERPYGCAPKEILLSLFGRTL